MKKLFAFILASVLCISLCSCGANEEAVEPETSETEKEEIESNEESSFFESKPAVKKELLKLKHSLGDFDSAEGSVMNKEKTKIPFETPEGLENGSGENIEIPNEVISSLRKLCPDFNPDENWQNWVNYYTQDFAYGMLEFIYYIGDIATDKVVFCTIENGFITEAGFRNITAEVDEDELLERIRAFEESYEQEKYELKAGEEFLSEEVHYVYYYVPEKLVYGYQLFFYMEGKFINNEYFSEYFVP